MPYTNSFSNNTAPTGPQLDGNLNEAGLMGIIPCTVSGTNTLALTVQAKTPTFTAYAAGMKFSGVAAASNTGAATAQVGALAALPVYRDSPAGPVALAGNEIIIACAFTLVYDSALNAGNGGFHLVSTTNSLSFVGGTVTGFINMPNGSLIVGPAGTAATLARLLSTLATVSYTVVPTQTAQDQDISFDGVQLTDSISLGATVVPTDAAFSAFVPAAGTVTARVLNAGSGSISAFTVVLRATAHGFF